MKDYILIVDKPAAHTSFDVVARLRGILKTKKIGHSGTLDPEVTGVLPVFVGRATKAVDLMPDTDKRYRAEILLGKTTDTQDMTGRVIAQSDEIPTAERIFEVAESFIGVQKQLPPMYSAVQKDGKRLYEYARAGVEIERDMREIRVYDLKVVDISLPYVTVEVFCSKGTYVRTLAHDMGAALGCGGAVSEMRRIYAGGFWERDTHTLEQIAELAAADRLGEIALPVERIFEPLEKIYLAPSVARLFMNGVKLDIDRLLVPLSDAPYAVREEGGGFLGLAVTDAESRTLKSKKLFGSLAEEKPEEVSG